MTKQLCVCSRLTYWFSSDRQGFTAVKVFSSVKNRPLSSKDFVICVHHGFHDISVDSSRTLVWRYAQIIMMNVPPRKANLKKVCPQSDRFPHRPKIGPFWRSEISADAISCKHIVKIFRKQNYMTRKKESKLRSRSERKPINS